MLPAYTINNTSIIGIDPKDYDLDKNDQVALMLERWEYEQHVQFLTERVTDSIALKQEQEEYYASIFEDDSDLSQIGIFDIKSQIGIFDIPDDMAEDYSMNWYEEDIDGEIPIVQSSEDNYEKLEEEMRTIYLRILAEDVDNDMSLHVVRELGDLYSAYDRQSHRDCILVGGVKPIKKRVMRRRKPPAQGNRGRGGLNRGRRGENGNFNVSLTRLQEPFSGLPQIFSMKLRYAENSYQFPITPITQYSTQEFALNDPWDPWVPTGGKAANEFYQIMSFYKYCRVKAATLKVTILQPDFASNRNVGIAMIPNWDGDSYPNNIDDLWSMDPTRVTIVRRPTDLMTNALVIKRRYRIPDIFNEGPSQYFARAYTGLTDVYNSGSAYYSPTNLAKVEVMVFKFDEVTTDSVKVIGFVEIDFEVTFAQKYTWGEKAPLGYDELKTRSQSLARKAFDEKDEFDEAGQLKPPEQCITIGSEVFRKV